ncbi:HYC_CC_PP family protein [Niastella vici]|uniref:HYC_CC_PP family protein n=1 Tax=Niastella vici TaxID=1703345 RepID=UPI0011803D26|nr:hypothetical protein [Niastella vici]
MKRFLVAILALVYLVSSIGANTYRHYCMDRLVAWGLGHGKDKSNACPYCGMVKAGKGEHCINQVNGCCHDEHQQFKIGQDQKTVDAGFKLPKPILPVTAYSPFTLSAFFIHSPVLAYPTTHGPPSTGKVSLFVRNCVFRI